MMAKRRKQQVLSDQLREIIRTCGMSRYRISKEAGIDASQLCRFVHGTGRMTTDSLDRLGTTLGLRLVQEED